MNKAFRMIGVALGMALVALLAVTPVLAQGPATTTEDATPSMWERMHRWSNDGERQFVDEDGDGLCDICGSAAGEGYGAGGGLGANGAGSQFVDEDGDGLCDLAGSGRMGGMMRAGR